MQTHSLLPVPTICFSLSSASPAHSPKEEYVITQSTDTTKEETVHDQSEDQGELRDDKSELTEKKSVTGWLAAHQLFSSKVRSRESKHTHTKSLPVPAPTNTQTLVHLFLSEEVSLCGLCPSLGHDGQEEEKSWEEQLDAHQEQLEKEMQEARRMVFRLQVSS